MEKGTRHGPSLHLSLKNIAASTQTILTGMKTGDADYRVSEFTFVILGHSQ